MMTFGLRVEDPEVKKMAGLVIWSSVFIWLAFLGVCVAQEVIYNNGEYSYIWLAPAATLISCIIGYAGAKCNSQCLVGLFAMLAVGTAVFVMVVAVVVVAIDGFGDKNSVLYFAIVFFVGGLFEFMNGIFGFRLCCLLRNGGYLTQMVTMQAPASAQPMTQVVQQPTIQVVQQPMSVVQQPMVQQQMVQQPPQTVVVGGQAAAYPSTPPPGAYMMV